ncbi:RNA polymerase sigma factor [Povalibacter sp.]|uniref:RNA polymerase sigma factor n=1 Tax=Povalibacter sp. TaxID=1962978 RepID=UPI002F40498B
MDLRPKPEQRQPTSNEHELRLLGHIARQDRDAFRELYFLYHRRLSRFISRLTSRRDLAEEIINDTLWIVWKKAGDFRGASQVSTWILGIAYRQSLTTLRRANAHPTVEESEARGIAVAEDSYAIDETREWLKHALISLPIEQRMVIEFTYFLGHSCEEIAMIMGCPVNTVKTRMFYARRKLRTALAQLADGDRANGE